MNSKANDINSLVDTIVNYYTFIKDKDSQGEEWKMGTEKDNVSSIPTEVDDLVKKVFISELKKLTE